MPEPSVDSQERRDARRPARARSVRRRRITALVALAALVAGVAAALAVAGGGGSSPKATTGPSAAAPTAPATTAQPPPAAPPKGTVRVAVVGDIVMGTPDSGLPPDGGASFFSSVAPLLTGNVVLGNLEGTLATGGSSKCGAGSSNCYAFHTPPSYARWLKAAGFTVMNLANNHALDFGPDGQRQTVAALERAGILHTGRPGEVARTRVHGLRVALLGFAPYSWADPLTNIPKARQIVAKAARSADIVIVMAHAGAEGSGATHVRPGTEYFLGENRGDPEAFAHAVVDAGADLVVMSGPHVMRGMEFRRGRLIAYSMGNFAGYKVFGLGGTLSTSGVLQVTLAGDGRFVSGRLRPTQLVGPGTPAPGGGAVSLVSQLSREDLRATAARIGADGRIRRPA